jgi:hypothetical protein
MRVGVVGAGQGGGLGVVNAGHLTDALAGVDEVPWAALQHAYGSAVDVPGHLRELRSPAPSIRQAACSNLLSSIYHQGSRWQASASAVPFLVALVDDPATPQRDMVLRLLRAVAIGDLDDTALPFDPASTFAGAAPATDELVDRVVTLLAVGEPLDDMAGAIDAVSIRWARDAYHAAARSFDRYVAWLRDRDAAVAAGAAELLPWYATTSETRSRVTHELVAVPNIPVVARASANLALAYVPAGPARPDGVAESRLTGLLAAADAGVALTAAVALALRLRADAPEAVLEPLMSAKARTAELGETMAELPWSRSLLGFASVALGRIGLG